MIPIADVQGRVIGFGARLLGDEGKRRSTAAKYLNSKDSRVFKKGEALFAINLAKEAARRRDK